MKFPATTTLLLSLLGANIISAVSPFTYSPLLPLTTISNKKNNRLPSRQPLSPPAMQNLSIIRVIVRSLTVDTDPKNALHKLPMRHGNVL